MSATMAPATAANTLTGGLTSEKAASVATKPRKRATATSRSESEGTEAPALSATTATTTTFTRSRRSRAPVTSAANATQGDAAATAYPETPEQNAAPGAGAAAASPVKHKAATGATKERKQSSIWDVTGHLFSRLFLIFVVSAGLGSTVWSLRAKPLPPVLQHRDAPAFEIEKLEEFVTKTTKWMQVQLEVIDTKIEKEASEIRSEMRRKLESQAAHAASELKGLKSQVDRLHQNSGALTRNEAVELTQSVMDRRGGRRAFSLEDVRAAARHIVLHELEKHAADGIGRPDYALASGGGRVVGHSDGFFPARAAAGEWPTLALRLLLGAPQKHPLASKVLEPSFGEPGQCLPLKGGNVFVDIALRTAICPDAVTLEHVSKSAGYDVKSAPKEFQVFGWRERRPPAADRGARPSAAVRRLLGAFMYDTDSPTSIQTFPLADDGTGGELVDTVRLQVLSNHGNPLHTCIYRFRVHGADLQTTQPAAA